MTWLFIPIFCFTIAYYRLVVRKVGLLAPDSLFAYMQLLMAAGSLPLLDPARPADRVHGYILAYTLMTYMVVGFFAHSHRRVDAALGSEVRTFRPRFNTKLLLTLSIVVSVLYFVTVGYVAAFQGLQNTFTGGAADVTSLRLESYSGSRYLFPGYVNQFKNVLLPALTVVFLTFWARSGRLPNFSGAALTLVAIISLVGTGQRGAFVTFVVVTVVFIYMLDRRAFPKRTVGIAIIVLPIIILSTLALGRSSAAVGEQTSGIGVATVAMREFSDRVLNDNQLSSVTGFRYIYENEQNQNGSEWVRSFEGLLPGNPGSDLANRIFASLYGSTRGTSPESIWGSIYFNFGLAGIALAPIVLALIAAFITTRVRRVENPSTLTLIGMAGTITVFGTWVASTPIYLLNNGLVVYVLLWSAGRAHDRRSAPLPTEPPPSPLAAGNSGRTGTQSSIPAKTPSHQEIL